MRRRALLLTTTVRTEELEELVFALGADVAARVIQRRPQPDPVTYLGSGKLEEARATQRALGAELVVVNAALKPGQIFALQRFFAQGAGDGDGADGAAGGGAGVEVYDRTRLILEIFRERARSPEARLQVELAQLTYDMPLVKEAIHLQKKGERQAAMFGGGEYGVNEYHDMMRRRMARIRRDLDKMRAERAVRRKHRRRGGFHLVSLAGYTNAGKSSLLRALSEKDALVEDRYFSTLSTKTARALSDRREILVTDTVGFIEDLPPWMVEAFHSTLEEIALADVILLVVDASDAPDEIARRLRSSLRTLYEFDADRRLDRGAGARDGDERGMGGAGRGAAGRGGARGARSGRAGAAGSRGAASASLPGVPYRMGLAPILVALNKTDRVAPHELAARVRWLVEDGLVDESMLVAVSAHTRDGLPELYDRLIDLIPDYDEYEVALPASPESESLIAWMHTHADVIDLTRGQEVHLHVEAKRSLRTELLARLAAVGASALKEVVRAPREEGEDRGEEDAQGARGAAGVLAPDEPPIATDEMSDDKRL